MLRIRLSQVLINIQVFTSRKVFCVFFCLARKEVQIEMNIAHFLGFNMLEPRNPLDRLLWTIQVEHFLDFLMFSKKFTDLSKLNIFTVSYPQLFPYLLRATINDTSVWNYHEFSLFWLWLYQYPEAKPLICLGIKCYNQLHRNDVPIFVQSICLFLLKGKELILVIGQFVIHFLVIGFG